MTPFTQYKPWMIDRYGDPLFRIPVEIASSCPHGRCAFCSEKGSRAQQTQRQESPIEQAEEAIRFSKRRYKAKKFMLYIQAFTTDLTDPEEQKVILNLLDHFNFTAISIGTRPDCLPTEALDFIETLAQKESLACKNPLEVWIELGVQTVNDETLVRIDRGHDWTCSQQAILDLAERGIYVAPHVILGLPNETTDDWNRTASELAKLPISGIKIHNLHVVKGTALAENPPPTMNHWEYAEALMDFLRRIPAGIPVMRISTDTPDDELIAPHWHLEKGQFLDYVIQQMKMREITQGDLLNDGTKENEKTNIPVFNDFSVPVTTADGSVTFFSKDWKEHYHTKTGARLEAQKKFVDPSGLKEKLQTRNVRLLDVCFGLGNNSLAALCEADKDAGATGKLDITALEMDKRVVRAASQFFHPLKTDPVDWNKILSEVLHHSKLHINDSTITLRWGDARFLIQHLENNAFDIVFHDPFSSQHCPELWTVEFFQQLYRVIKPDGLLLTYSSSMPVRGAMLEAGFFIAETVPGHQMGNGTIASRSDFPTIGIHNVRGIKLDNHRSIPYRDEYLCATSKAILRQRQEVREASD